MAKDTITVNMNIHDIPIVIEELEKAQKEIERLKELLDYTIELKNRINKAIKYIQNNKLYDFIYDDEELFEVVSDKVAKDYLLNILGGDNNE